jgi:hypothetical protein
LIQKNWWLLALLEQENTIKNWVIRCVVHTWQKNWPSEKNGRTKNNWKRNLD